MKILALIICLFYNAVYVKTIEQEGGTSNLDLHFAKYLKFLEEKDFETFLTKIPSITDSIFNISSAILSVDSSTSIAETDLIKVVNEESERLYKKFDEWHDMFYEIKFLVDWSLVKVDFDKIENGIISGYKFPYGSKDDWETKKNNFINNYETNIQFSADYLYEALTNDKVDPENLLKTVQKSTHYHRNQARTFMIGMVQLLTQAIQIEAIYVNLKSDHSKENINFVKSLWEEKLENLKDKMKGYDDDTTTKFKIQYEKDLDEMLETRYALTNEQFSKVIYNMLTEKYDWREWFVLVYAPISGFDNHAISTCQGTYRFRAHGRNIVISSVNRDEAKNARSRIGANYSLIGSFTQWRFEIEYPKVWINYMRSVLPSCSQADTLASVAWGSNVWYMSTTLVVYKKNCVFDNQPCYNSFIFA